MTTEYSTFSNEQMDIDKLPSLTDLQFQALDSAYAKTNRIIFGLCTLIPVLLGLSLQLPFVPIGEQVSFHISNGTIIYGVLASLFTIYRFFADTRKFYVLREYDISYLSGLIFKRTVSQPILRIQHVELKRGPVERKIGLASLQVFSAGGAMHTFEIPGLPLEVAEKTRQYILNHKDTNQHG